MKQSELFRLGGLVSMIAGLWSVLNTALTLETTSGLIFFAGSVLTTFALIAIYAAQAQASGLLGLAGLVFASIGNFIFLGEGLWGEVVFVIGGWWAYALATLLSGLLFLLTLTGSTSILTNPGDPGFLSAVTFLLLALIAAIAGIRSTSWARQPG